MAETIGAYIFGSSYSMLGWLLVACVWFYIGYYPTVQARLPRFLQGKKKSIVIGCLFVVLFFLNIFFFFASSQVSSIIQEVNNDQSLKYYKIAQYPNDFKHATSSLEFLIDSKGGREVENHFCIVGQQLPNQLKIAFIHWREKEAIIAWEGTTTDGLSDLAVPRLYADLHKDVVATQGEIGGGTHLVTRAWWDSTVSSCEKYGAMYVVPPRRPALAVMVSSKTCSDMSEGAKKKECYAHLARETGEGGYCWKTDNFYTCFNTMVVSRSEPGLCNGLYPESRGQCLQYYESHI